MTAKPSMICGWSNAASTTASARPSNIAIDGQSTDGWSSDKVRDTLRGELGTEVKVTIRRAGMAEPLTVKIERGAVDLPSISASYVARPGIGYIGLSRGFHSTTSDELSSA